MYVKDKTYISEDLITSPVTCSKQYYRTQSPTSFWNMIEETCFLVCKILVHKDFAILEFIPVTREQLIENLKLQGNFGENNHKGRPHNSERRKE